MPSKEYNNSTLLKMWKTIKNMDKIIHLAF